MEEPSPSPTTTEPVGLKEQQQETSDDRDEITTKTHTLQSKTTSSNTASKYIRDFESLFVPINVDKLRNNALNGDLRHCQFRSLCWRYFLRCLPENYDKWLEACKINRQRYIEIRSKHLSLIKPEQATQSDISDDNELIARQFRTRIEEKDADDCRSNDAQSLDCDHKTIYKTIERDVVRTFPDMEFFRQTEMQEILSQILFNFANENPNLSYKQGMHELLATLLYVAHTDSQNCLINYEGDYANEAIATLLDLKYLEHDVFHLFSALMMSIESWYQNDEILIVPEQPKPLGTVATRSGSYISDGNSKRYSSTASDRSRAASLTSTTSSDRLGAPRQQVISVLGLKLKTISENIVRKHDSELYNHLEALQIAPQIYGIRWMRLLFGREYEFLDLLTVWDAIICDQNSMSLVDYVFASMLMTIREELINGDYTDCLNNLMRHQFKDVPYVIRLALHLRDPINCARPKQYRTSAYNSQYHRSMASQNLSSYSTPSRQQPSATASSLTSKLSQQYISDKLGLRDNRLNHRDQQSSNKQTTQVSGSQRFISSRDLQSQHQFLNDNGDENSKRIFSMTSMKDDAKKKVNLIRSGVALGESASSSIGYLAQQASQNFAQVAASGTKSGAKFLPNINKIVSSLGQNIQDMSAPPNGMIYANPRQRQQQQQQQLASRRDSTPKQHQHLSSPSATQSKTNPNPSMSSSKSFSHKSRQHSQQQPNDLILSPGHQVKEYEMLEMIGGQPLVSPSSSSNTNKVPLSRMSFTTASLDVSNESYEDLHSIVDYCWRLLSEQIDSLQRCLPKEKGLHSEDEIFVALAQLKKVRDVLKGSLRLEDELESVQASTASAMSSNR